VPDDLGMRENNRLRQALTLTHGLDHHVAGHGAGDLTMLVPTHAICDQPQAELGISPIGVFIVLPTQARMRAVSEFHAHAQNPTQEQ
jgi:hypothetical protein